MRCGPVPIGAHAEATAESRPKFLGQRVAFAQHSHAVRHAAARVQTASTVHDRTDHRGHLIHHVVRQVAVQHPVADILGLKLDIARLGHADDDGVHVVPELLRNAAAFCSRHDKLHAVHVNRMVVHSDVDHADAHTLALFDDHRRAVGSGLAVEAEPVEFHRQSVRHVVIGE